MDKAPQPVQTPASEPSSVQQPVLYMKVTEALRAPGPQNITELSKVYNIAEFPNLLLLAVDLSPLDTVKWVTKLYEQRHRNFNEVDPQSGNTALHVAVASNRVAIVRHLMQLLEVDDTIPNKDGITAPELASNGEMEEVLQNAQTKFAEKTAVRLKQAFKQRDLRDLEHIYANPRVSELLNINGFDPETHRTVLHDAAIANDLSLVKFILAHGGDPLVRDTRNHKLPEDYTTSDEIKGVLSQSAKSKSILDQTSKNDSQAKGGVAGAASGKPVQMEGYLKKWTNITSGYKLRYFKLQNGELSYYKRPEDTKHDERLIRGSIGLRHASVRLDSSEKNKFAIRTPSTKFHLKATHPAETNKWVWALQHAITAVRDQHKAPAGASRAQSHSRTPSQASIQSHTGVAAGAAGAAGAVGAAAGAHASSQGHSRAPHTINTNVSGAPGAASAGLSPASHDVREVSIPENSTNVPVVHQNDSPLVDSTEQTAAAHSRKESMTSDGGWLVNDIQTKGDNYESDEDEDEEDEVVLQGPQISVESLISRLSAIKDLMGMLVFQIQDETMRDAISTTQGSIDVLSSDIVMLQRQDQAHIRRAKSELEKSESNQRLWASNYRDLEIHSERLEGQLYSLKAQNGNESDDEFFDTMDNAPLQEPKHEHKHEEKEAKPEVPVEKTEGLDLNENKEASKEAPKEASKETTEDKNVKESKDTEESKDTKEESSKGAAAAGTGAAVAGAAGAAGAGAASHKSEFSESNPPPLRDYTEIASIDRPDQYGSPVEPAKPDPSAVTDSQKQVYDKIIDEQSFAGYEHGPREKLKISADNRPKLSLWGILKNLIGKDMTKMTLPVTFNECTSLLQRSAEDMEYTELLDKAVEAIDDPGLRMVYVAAFAGSSYSSTIDRVAKPFNPLLGETYEYARPDKGYRMFAEQVSHHPPIGALIAESEHWDFYGESNVESKFYGRSFDINPLGLWYLNLRPNKGAGVESELYSFRKITSSVVGIMLGNPVVDNYGDMEITNHTLGIKAIVNYKARGWRGSSAYKLQGRVNDKNGKELWTIGGQWNDKMYGMKSGDDSKILLWEAHERHRTPFNLTDFAISLNGLPEDLVHWLPPTDTRLRPDQRAMEEGRYDDASEEKNRVEEKQRAARREREEKGEKYEPKWFKLEKHPVTGKDYYKPIGDYWGLRGAGKLPDQPRIF